MLLRLRGRWLLLRLLCGLLRSFAEETNRGVDHFAECGWVLFHHATGELGSRCCVAAEEGGVDIGELAGGVCGGFRFGDAAGVDGFERGEPYGKSIV